MKTPQMFVPNKNSKPNIKQLLKVPDQPQLGERYKTEIERLERKNDQYYDFMLKDEEIQKILEKLPAKNVEGLERIVITSPLRNEQYKLFGKYEKGMKISGKYRNGRIYLFKHLNLGGIITIDLGYKTVKYTPDEFKIKNYKALLHEVGHHVGIKDFNNDSEDFAEDYAVKGINRLVLE